MANLKTPLFGGTYLHLLVLWLLGREKIFKKKSIATKVEKKVCWQSGQKNKFVDRIDEKYVDQNKPANGNVIIKEGIRQNVIFPFFNET